MQASADSLTCHHIFLTYQLPWCIPNPSCGQVAGKDDGSDLHTPISRSRLEVSLAGTSALLQLSTSSAAARMWGPEAQLRIMLCQQVGKRRGAAQGEPKSVHCPQDSLTFPLGFLLSGVSGLGLGLGERITLDVFPFQFGYWTMTIALRQQK